MADKRSWREVAVGSTRERIGTDGSVRFTGRYRDLKGHQRSAGTFTPGGRPTAPGSGRSRRSPWASQGTRPRAPEFGDYAEKTWLPNHEVEATTCQSYSYILRRHVSRSQADYYAATAAG